MAVYYTIAKGPLISFGAHPFIVGRSQLQGDWDLSAAPDVIELVNSPNVADGAGLAVQAIHGAPVTWIYDIIPQGANKKAVQDELTALITAMKTPNLDGTSGQVALLTVALLGYVGVNATGMARLIGVKSLATYSVRERVALSFLIPQGMSYTA